MTLNNLDEVMPHRYIVRIEQKSPDNDFYYLPLDFVFEDLDAAKEFACTYVDSVRSEDLYRATILIECMPIYSTPETIDVHEG